MCKSILVMIMLVVVIVVSGCQTVDGILQDTAGIANAIRQKVTTPMADKANARDAKTSGEKLTRYHAEQASRFATFNSNKEQ